MKLSGFLVQLSPFGQDCKRDFRRSSWVFLYSYLHLDGTVDKTLDESLGFLCIVISSGLLAGEESDEAS
jgi:hypothetical protein